MLYMTAELPPERSGTNAILPDPLIRDNDGYLPGSCRAVLILVF